MGHNSRQTVAANITAIRVALQWKKGEALSEDRVDQLKGYSGFGGLKAVLFPFTPKEEWIKLNASLEDLALYPQMMELHEVLQTHLSANEYKQAIDAIRNSILTAFYTPAVVPKTLFEALKEEEGLQPKALYEPSGGAGVFITEAVSAFPELERVRAVEKDLVTGKVLEALCSSLPVPTTVQIRGFEQTDNKENGSYDLIVSNIPFGAFRVHDETFTDNAIAGKIHNYL